MCITYAVLAVVCSVLFIGIVCVSNVQLKYSNNDWTLTKNQRNSAYKR